MIKQYKIDEVSNLKAELEEKSNIIFTNFSGVKVKELGELRNQLREKNATYKVVKNNYFKRALAEAGYEGVDQFLKGPVAVAFTNDSVGEVAKILKNFSKEQENFSFSAGVLGSVVYDEAQINKIADLPSREALLSQIAQLINGPATKNAMGISQVMASLARGINAVSEKNNG